MATTTTNNKDNDATRQKLALHAAKTVYFNGLWKDVLLRSGMLCLAFSTYFAYKIARYGPNTTITKIMFELLSAITVIPTLLFLHRKISPVKSFQLSFICALFQALWFSQVLYTRYYHTNTNQSSELNADQLPIGSLCFIVIWNADRYMIRSLSMAENALHQHDKKKKQ